MKKTGKMAAAVLLAASVAALASGCGQKEAQETSAPESTVSQTEESASQAEETESLEEENQSGAVSVMTGTVLDAAMNSIVIQNEEYPQGLILTPRKILHPAFPEGLTLDMNVTLFYTGETDGEDTTKTEVILVRESRDSDSTLTAGSVSGTVSEVTSEAVVIETEDGEKISVARGHELSETEKEPAAGDQLTVYYSCPGGDESVKEAELIR